MHTEDADARAAEVSSKPDSSTGTTQQFLTGGPISWKVLRSHLLELRAPAGALISSMMHSRLIQQTANLRFSYRQHVRLVDLRW